MFSNDTPLYWPYAHWHLSISLNRYSYNTSDNAYISDILFDSQQSSEAFIDQLQLQYPEHFSDIQNNQLDHVYDRILQARLVWPQGINNTKASSYTVTSDSNHTTIVMKSNDSVTINGESIPTNGHKLFERTKVNETRPSNISTVIPQHMPGQTMQKTQDEEDRSVLKTVGFIFHKISLTISVILVLWVSMEEVTCKYFAVFLCFKWRKKRGKR